MYYNGFNERLDIYFPASGAQVLGQPKHPVDITQTEDGDIQSKSIVEELAKDLT